MRKKDILELKRRLKKDDCTFTRMCGCYVDADKNIVLNLNETFLNLDEDEFFKYLEIAKKVLSGTVGNNLLNLEFPLGEESEGGRQYSLMELKKSRLKDETLLNDFYKSIIDSYDYTGNFLILVFHDAYDVMTKTSDNSKLDESEEVYEYLLCAICPVSLTKPGLSYFQNDNRIGSRQRDWIVEMPSLGFVFPAFTDRSTDVNSVLYYTKNAKDPHPELMEETLGCKSKQTATEQKETFTNIICDAIGIDDTKSDHVFMEIQENLNTLVDEHNTVNDKDDEPIVLTNNVVRDLLFESGVPEEITEKIEKTYTEEFGDTPPIIDHLIDSKVLAANEQRKKEQRLEKQVQILQNKLDKNTSTDDPDNLQANNDASQITTAAAMKMTHDINSSLTSPANDEANNEISAAESHSGENSDNNHYETESNGIPSLNYDIVLKVKPEKVPEIKSQFIDGKKCIVIPIDENEQANVNGVDTVL